MDNLIYVPDFQFIHPCLILCSGPTGIGKSETVLKIIQRHRELITPTITRLVFVYSEEQPNLFGRIRRSFPVVEFVYGIEKLQELEFDNSVNTLLIVDDLYFEATSSKYFLDLAIKGLHHKSITLILIGHNLFQQNKYARTLTLQTKYFILFKNPRDINQIKYLGRQILPTGSSHLLEKISQDAFTNYGPYNSLIISIHPLQDAHLCFLTNLFPPAQSVNWIDAFPHVWTISD
jgi:hypothetical protein